MKIRLSCYSLATLILLTFTSCAEKYEAITGIQGVFATHSSSVKTIGEETIVQVFTTEGEEVTEDATIQVNGENIIGNTFVADEVGFYEIKASYFNVDAPDLSVEYQDGSQRNFKKRVLVEDYTGTWCGWCPRVSYGMSKVDNISDDVVFVAIHRAPVGTSDPYNYTNAGTLEQLINSPGYPKGFINRIHQWQFPEPFNIYQVLEFTHGSNPRLGLAMESSINENIMNINVKVDFAKDFQNLKLVVQVLENGLVWPQVNYTEYYNGEDPIENYEHNYTLRQTLTDILGDEIPNSETRKDNLWQSNFEISIPDNIEDVTNVDIVAFIVDQDGQVVNVRKSKLEDVQEFEIL